jgi:hypothetical protein
VAATRIKAHVVVVSPNAVTSPLTGMRAVFFDWTLFVRSRREATWRSNPNRLEGADDVYEEIGRAGHGQDFLVERTAGVGGDRILLEATSVRYRVAHTDASGPLLQQAPPAELQHLVPREPSGPIHVRELALTKGDVVLLRGAVVPAGAQQEPGGLLRSQGAVVLEENVPGRSRLRRFLEAIRWLAR